MIFLRQDFRRRAGHYGGTRRRDRQLGNAQRRKPRLSAESDAVWYLSRGWSHCESILNGLAVTHHFDPVFPRINMALRKKESAEILPRSSSAYFAWSAVNSCEK
jgi:hypothetical protein